MSIQYLPNFVVQKVIPNSQKLTESELSLNTMFIFMNFIPLEMRRKNKNWYWRTGQKRFPPWSWYDLSDIGEFNLGGLREFLEILENRSPIPNYCWLHLKNLCGDTTADIDWVNDQMEHRSINSVSKPDYVKLSWQSSRTMVRNLRKFILAHSTKRNKLAWFNKARSPRILYSVAGAETPNTCRLIILIRRYTTRVWTFWKYVAFIWIMNWYHLSLWLLVKFL